MVKDMTRGSVFPLLVSFSVPLMLGSICQQFYSVVDAIVLGKGVGVDALAAAGATGALNFFIIGFVMGMTQGFSITTSQRFGAEDPAGLRKSITHSVYLSVAFTLLITVLSLLGSRGLLLLLRTPQNILEDALLYLRIIFLGIGATVFYNVGAAILRAMGDSISPLVIIIISSVANAALDVILVIVLGWGVPGAALATVASQLLSGFMCLFVLRRLPLLSFQKEDWSLDFSMILGHIKLGLPIGIMNSVTAVGGMLLQTLVNQFGSVIVAAYTVGQKILGIVMQPGDIVGLALSTFVGQNLGAKRTDRIREGVRKALLLSLGINFLLGLCLLCFGRPIIAFFVTGGKEVIAAAYPYVATGACLLWSLGFLFVYRSALQSLGDTVIPMISGVVELSCRVAAAFLFIGYFGFYAIALAEVSAWFGAFLLLMIFYYRRIEKIVREL